jgi:hypothetical protein
MPSFLELALQRNQIPLRVTAALFKEDSRSPRTGIACLYLAQSTEILLMV